MYDSERKQQEEGFLKEIRKIKHLKLSKKEEKQKIWEIEEEEKKKLLEIDALKKVIEELKDDYDSILETKKKYEKNLSDMLKPREEDEQSENFLVVLRRWNSYTPALVTDLDANVGGGYFINWQGKGIVIDPGFDFLDNFFNQGFVIDDIDIVIITHAHIDHCDDFESLLTLIHEYNKNIEKTRKKLFKPNYNYHLKNLKINIDELDSKIKSISPNYKRNSNYFNVTKDLEDVNPQEKVHSWTIDEYYRPLIGQKKSIDVFMNLGALKKYLAWIPVEEDNEVKIKRIRPLEKGITYTLNDYNIKLNVIEAKHNDVLTKTYSCGLILELFDNILDPKSKFTKIGYTSDTMHDEDIENNYRDVDIIIPHLGSIDENDFSLNNTKRNKNHLMLKGVISTIYRSNAKLAIISEFGEELQHYKLKIVKALNEVFQSHMKTRCLTGDVGLKIYIPELTSGCSYSSSNCHDKGRGLKLDVIHEELDPANKSSISVIHFCDGCKNIYDMNLEETKKDRTS